ncbi:helix-turn-helix transcriptional regulator [Acidovorax sp. LjRoot38]|uniref:helix-turn-helix transcriptional regulator n=1 Tax=Acidovorax sp. LjRoot38 TaxID=3342327 RepID=UPI003F50790C
MQVVHQSRPVVPRDRLLRIGEVESVTSCKKSTIYQMMREGRFPKSLRLSSRFVVWPETAVLQWVQDRIADSQGAQK